MTATILNELWQLRNDPFRPKCDATGAPLKEDAIEQTLDPQIDPRVVQYYFDVYEWNESQLIQGLSRKDALTVFAAPNDLPHKSALLVLISGAGLSGLDSLANLLLHKLNVATKQRPLVVEIKLDASDPATILKSVAQRFILTFKNDSDPVVNKKSIVDDMRDTLEWLTKEEGGKKASYGVLFDSLAELLPSKRPVVLRIREGGDN